MSTVDGGFLAFREHLAKQFRGAFGDRDIGEAWMRSEAHALKGDRPPLTAPPGAVTIGVRYGASSMIAAVPPDRLDICVADWAEAGSKYGIEDLRDATRNLVVASLATNAQVAAGEANLLIRALVWLTLTGPNAAVLRPFMEKGDMSVLYEISDTEPGHFRFHLDVDDATAAAIANA